MRDARQPYGGRTPEEYERLLLVKLELSTIRSTLAFAGLYQITHEMLKDVIIGRVHDFYFSGLTKQATAQEKMLFKAQVMDAAKTEGSGAGTFEASVAWLCRYEAITQQQAARLNEIYNHRHELTHELIAFIVDVDRNPDAQLFVDALSILRDVHSFWTQHEIDIGSFDHAGSLTVEDATPLSLIVLQRCIDAWQEQELS